MHASSVITFLRTITAVLALWSLAAVIAAVPVAALFRLQARADRIWRALERRRLWREASGWSE